MTSKSDNVIIQSSDGTKALKLHDIPVGRSLGAARKSYDIMDLHTGKHFDLMEGTWLRHVEVFAGKGTNSPYRKAWKYVQKHPEIATNEEDWQHVKAVGTINYYGEPRRAEIHWSQCDEVGIDDMFIKEWLE